MILYAPNINSGGGLVLLNTVIEDEVFGKVSSLFIDSRCPIKEEFKGIDIIKFEPNILSRLKAELVLKKIAKKSNEDIVCFGNLPPIFKHQNKTKVFLQNAYLLKNIPLPTKLKLKLRTIYERFILYFFSVNVDEFMVQTNWMKESLEKFCDINISITPILPKFPLFNEDKNLKRKFDLLAITGSEEHKNLDLLLSLLENYKSKVNVCIVCPEAIQINNKNINLTQFTGLSREEIFEVYQSSKYLMTLSKFESFCLPIFEASHFGTKNIVLNEFFIDDKSKIYKRIQHENINSKLF